MRTYIFRARAKNSRYGVWWDICSKCRYKSWEIMNGATLAAPHLIALRNLHQKIKGKFWINFIKLNCSLSAKMIMFLKLIWKNKCINGAEIAKNRCKKKLKKEWKIIWNKKNKTKIWNIKKNNNFSINKRDCKIKKILNLKKKRKHPRTNRYKRLLKCLTKK